MALNDDIYSRTLRHRALLSMYEKRLESELDKLLVSHNLKMRQIVATGNTKNIAALLRRLDIQRRSAYRNIYRMSINELNKLAGVSARFHKSTFTQALRGIYKARGVAEGTTVNNLIIRNNGTLGKQFTDISINERRIVNRLVRSGISSGLGTASIISNIRRTGTALSRAQTNTLARTAITDTSNFISDETYKLNDDVIDGYQYVATLDGRTSLICARLDGKVYDVNSEQSPRPPQHFGCRSTTIPIVKSANQLMDTQNNRISKRKITGLSNGRRASINGQVPARLTYQEWLTTQPNDIKLAILGTEGRVRVFNQGTLKLTAFSNRDGQLVSLKRLEELSN